MNRNYVISGFLFLFVGSYLDAVRGPLLPILVHTFSISYGQASWVLILGSVAAIFSTLALMPLLNRYSEKKVGILGLNMLVLLCFLTHGVENFLQLLLLAFLLGGTLSYMGALSNMFVIRGTLPENRTRVLCGLHVIYCLGAFCSPLIASIGDSYSLSWRWILTGIPIFFILFLALLLFKIKEPTALEIVEVQSPKLSRMQWVIVLAFACYVGGEVLTSIWMVPYLMNYHHLTFNEATRYVMGFFAVMGLGRLLCFFSLKPHHEKKILVGCLILTISFSALGHLGNLWAFSLAGSLGPFFPLFIARLNKVFPTQWRSLTVWVLTAMQVILGLAHFGAGKLADMFGIEQAYMIPIILLLVALTLVTIYFEWEKKNLGRASTV